MTSAESKFASRFTAISPTTDFITPPKNHTMVLILKLSEAEIET
jgi:hypothetical protein